MIKNRTYVLFFRSLFQSPQSSMYLSYVCRINTQDSPPDFVDNGEGRCSAHVEAFFMERSPRDLVKATTFVVATPLVWRKSAQKFIPSRGVLSSYRKCYTVPGYNNSILLLYLDQVGSFLQGFDGRFVSRADFHTVLLQCGGSSFGTVLPGVLTSKLAATCST